MENEIVQAIRTRLATAQEVLIVSHVRPDGDAVGSLVGLGLALRAAGKHVQTVLTDGVPSAFRHLPGADDVKTAVAGTFDTFITVDCADFKRTGKAFANLQRPDINIDHHITNEKFAHLNLIEGEEVATSAILTNHLPAWGYPITQPIAAALLTGIITDTLGFRTSNVTPEAMRQVATLMETGVDMPELYMRGLVRRSYAATSYWGRGLSNLQRKDGIVYASLSIADRKAAGYSGSDDADLINVVSAIDGFKIAMIFVEQPQEHVKISWRALEPGIDVSAVAVHFGGGGHAAAAGADVAGTLEDVTRAALKSTKEMLSL
ncbi:MAG TPA: DHH family phosphoesterase [Anaerolineales bacterium]|nr:DHH family phosphoesterase [Anaerolineales bacterium]